MLAEILPRHILTTSLLSPIHCCSTLRFSFSISALAHRCIMQAAVPPVIAPGSATCLPPAQPDMQFLGSSLLWESVTCCAHGVAEPGKGSRAEVQDAANQQNGSVEREAVRNCNEMGATCVACNAALNALFWGDNWRGAVKL